MLDISLTELLLTAVVAFLVIDPKDIPRVLREVMGFFRTIRETGEEVRRSVVMLAEEETAPLNEELKQIQHASGTHRYIVDEAGNFQEVFDVAELMESTSKPDTRVH